MEKYQWCGNPYDKIKGINLQGKTVGIAAAAG